MAQCDKGKKSPGGRQRQQQEFEEPILTAGNRVMKRLPEELRAQRK